MHMSFPSLYPLISSYLSYLLFNKCVKSPKYNEKVASDSKITPTLNLSPSGTFMKGIFRLRKRQILRFLSVNPGKHWVCTSFFGNTIIATWAATYITVHDTEI